MISPPCPISDALVPRRFARVLHDRRKCCARRRRPLHRSPTSSAHMSTCRGARSRSSPVTRCSRCSTMPRYMLRRVGSDAFLNGSGDTITFPRDAGRRRHRIRGTGRGACTTLARRCERRIDGACVTPQRAGTRRTAEEYRYRAPANRRDGIPVGDIHTGSDLDVATAERVVRSVLDGTYKDVHGILLFQRGKLDARGVLLRATTRRARTRCARPRSPSSVHLPELQSIAARFPGVTAPVAPLLGYTSVRQRRIRARPESTLGHLLSMSSGLSCNDYDSKSPGNESTLYESCRLGEGDAGSSNGRRPGQCCALLQRWRGRGGSLR